MRNSKKESELLMKLVKNKLEKHKTADSMALELFLKKHVQASSRKEVCIGSVNFGIPQEK
jgi:hypothetical protein